MDKIKNVSEHSAITLFTSKFGTDILSRYDKFIEECTELNEAMFNYNEKKSPEALEHLLDEFSDVQGTFTHLASLFGLYQKEMLGNCIDKIKGRETNPNYKRYA